MSAVLMDGKALATEIRTRLKGQVAEFTERTGHVPGLGVVLVGQNPASQAYVSSKEKALSKTGMKSIHVDLPATATEQEIKAVVKQLAGDEAVDGILVQLPLPEGVNEFSVLECIPPHKDADGFHPHNLGRLLQGRPFSVPCTPKGVLHLLDKYGVKVAGKEAVVIGRSLIVGKPMAALLTNASATVTLAHSRTRDLYEVTRRADIVIVAVGKPGMINADHLDPHRQPVVVDVGINRVDGKLTGDVAFDDVKDVAGFLTPVPGGVGPLTVACLLENTLHLAKARRP